MEFRSWAQMRAEQEAAEAAAKKPVSRIAKTKPKEPENVPEPAETNEGRVLTGA